MATVSDNVSEESVGGDPNKPESEDESVLSDEEFFAQTDATSPLLAKRANRPQMFRAGLDLPTLVLIDMAFLASEFRYWHAFYVELHSGSDPDLPRKDIPPTMPAVAFLNALCKYGNFRREKAYAFIFQQPSDPDVIGAQQDQTMRRIRCSGPTWVEIGKAIESTPTIRRAVIVADGEDYVPLMSRLMDMNYDIMAIKHKQRGEDDWSRVPPEMPYQFSYYVIGEALGLMGGEL